jgi:hypothetical protein
VSSEFLFEPIVDEQLTPVAQECKDLYQILNVPRNVRRSPPTVQLCAHHATVRRPPLKRFALRTNACANTFTRTGATIGWLGTRVETRSNGYFFENFQNVFFFFFLKIFSSQTPQVQ